MTSMRVAIYARVSSDQQVEGGTVASQLAALQARLAQDGARLEPACRFVDEGYSGATLVRPGLERLRDLVATGTLDRVYVYAPDRLARRYAYQVLLLDEFRRGGAEVVFLNRPIGVSPEDDLLLQVQGMVAEYERAQILERSRRGKRHAARRGAVSVLSTAPYGYRYIDKRHGGGVARYEVIEDEAAVVRQMFEWLGRDRVSIGEVCRRLRQAGHRTRAGVAWQRGTVWRVLKNPAYAGRAAFGKTRAGPLRPRLRPTRGSCGQPRRGAAGYAVDPTEWIDVPVPAVVDPVLFAAVQEQLAENRRRSRQRLGGERYLLQGLVVCRRCGYGCHGRPGGRHSATGKPRGYAYYRCSGSDRHRFGGQRMCDNTQVRADLLEAAVWSEVERLLRNPGRIAAEHERRLRRGGEGGLEARNLAAVEAQLQRLRRGIGRLIDGYAEGLIERAEFEPRVAGLRQRLASLEEQRRGLVERTRLGSQLLLIIGRLEAFAARIEQNLDQLDRQQKRGLVRILVRRIEIDRDEVNVIFRVEPPPLPPEPVGLPTEQLVQRCHGHADRGVGARPDARGEARPGPGAHGGDGGGAPGQAAAPGLPLAPRSGVHRPQDLVAGAPALAGRAPLRPSRPADRAAGADRYDRRGRAPPRPSGPADQGTGAGLVDGAGGHRPAGDARRRVPVRRGAGGRGRGLPPLHHSPAAHGLAGPGAIRAFKRRQGRAWRHHQGRERPSAAGAGRGSLELPLPGPGDEPDPGPH